MAEQAWLCNRFAFAARTIREWIGAFGQEKAEHMVLKMLLDEELTPEYTAALKTAFGK